MNLFVIVLCFPPRPMQITRRGRMYDRSYEEFEATFVPVRRIEYDTEGELMHARFGLVDQMSSHWIPLVGRCHFTTLI